MRDAVTKEVIESLISDGVCESRQLDYKRDWVGRTDNDKKEFLADVVAFANTIGGTMLFGVDEERDSDGKQTGAPREAVGVEIAAADEEIRRIADIIRTGIAPRLPDVAISLVDGFPCGPVVAIHVPRSHRSPHMVSFKSSPKFFARVDRSRYALDVDELRDAFLRAEAMPARIRDFRSRRISAIDSGETPVPMDAGPLIVLHIVPMDTFSDVRAVPFADIDHAARVMRLPRFSGFDHAINLDGHILWVPVKGDGPRQAVAYAQVFRDGAMEAVDGVTILPASSDSGGTVLPDMIEATIVAQVAEYSRIFASMPIGNQLSIMITLMNAKGFHVVPRERYDERVIDRRVLGIPEVVVEREAAAIPATLKPALDMLWQACGSSRSPHFNAGGEWTNPYRNS
jgi:hypothetical protein